MFFIGILLSTLIFSNTQKTDCEMYVSQLISDIKILNFSGIPTASILYSGLGTNNPGQKYECESANYGYYLIYNKNYTTGSHAFTGICVPNQCTTEDVEVALQFLNYEVYGFSKEGLDTSTITGFVILSLWGVALIGCSVMLSCRSKQQNQYLKKSVLSQQEGVEPQEEFEEKFKALNFYAGYSKIFQQPRSPNLLGCFLFLSVLLLALSTDFSFKQSISTNQSKALLYFNSFSGIFVTNINLLLSTIVFVLGFRLAYSFQQAYTMLQIGRVLAIQLLKKWVLLLLLTFLAYALTYAIDEPLSQVWINTQAKDCSGYFWQNLFAIRSVQLDCKVCLPWLWLLQAELLLTILSAPFILIFRAKKWLGYLLISLLVVISTILGYIVLEDQGIVFRPSSLFNQIPEFIINHQSNSIIHSNCFFLGLLFGMMVLEGLHRGQVGQRTQEYKIARSIRKNGTLETCFQVMGGIIILVTPMLILPFLTEIKETDSQVGAYCFLTLSPLMQVIGLCLLVMPSLWECTATSTKVLTKVLGWSWWSPLEKVSLSFYVLTPVIIGYTTYSMQNGIYFDFETIFTYFLGDLTILYISCLLVTAALGMQINSLSNFLQTKLYGQRACLSSVLVVQ